MVQRIPGANVPPAIGQVPPVTVNSPVTVMLLMRMVAGFGFVNVVVRVALVVLASFTGKLRLPGRNMKRP